MTITSRGIRVTVLILLLSGAITAFATLGIVGRGGAINGPNTTKAIRYLLEFYLPLFGVVSAFYLAGPNKSHPPRVAALSMEAATLATFIVFLWVALPTLSLALSGTYEAAFHVVDSFKVYGSTLASTAITFVYARSSS